MNKTIYTSLLISLILSGNAIADLYSWTDNNGTRRYATSPPPKDTANVSVTSIKDSAVTPSPKPKVSKSNKSKSISSIASTSSNELIKTEEDEIDKEIQALWNKHWSDLEKGDIDAALQHYTPSSRKRYRPVLETLYGNKIR